MFLFSFIPFSFLSTCSGWLSVAMNDYYFKVISQNIVKYIRPHYIVVMGDIISHPFIKDTEFQSRTDRFKWYFDEELVNLKYET